MERLKFVLYSVLLVVVVSCHHKPQNKTLPPIKVEVATARSMAIYDRIEVASQISSLHEVVIQPRVDGFLKSINYSGGTRIKRGDLLFEIDPRQYNYSVLASKAELESAQAQELLARSNYLRAVPLAKIDAISQSDLDQYTATHSAAKAAVKSAREALNNAKLDVGYTKIYAPIDGLIAETSACEGDYVGPSSAISTLTTISYVDTVEVEVPIPTATYMKNALGEYVNNRELLSDIVLTLSGTERYEYMGEYDYTLADSPSASSTIAVVVKFPNPNSRLRSGVFARVTANIGAPKPRVVVPQIAVSQNQGINSVWVVAADSTVKFTEVKLGGTTDQDWIVESGLKSGDVVLTSGQLKVHNGAKVIPTKR